MGGKALNFETRRVNKEEYNQLYEEIKTKLKPLAEWTIDLVTAFKEANKLDSELFIGFKQLPFVLFPSYRNKETFGDMDILMCKEVFDKRHLKQKLKELFEYKDIFCNSDIWSFDYKDFQIDLVFVPFRYYETAVTYMSYDPIGNLMGKVANRLGCKYGWNGLYKKVYTEDRSRTICEIELTLEPKKIFEFLGYDYDRFLKGFDTLEEIFEYAVSSKYFNKSIFQIENLRHEDRTRNRKRVSYMLFLQWLKSKPLVENYENLSNRVNLSRLNSYFPEIKLIERVAEAKKKEIINKAIHEKLNGHVIMELTGLKDKELGTFIGFVYGQIKDKYNVSTNDFVLCHSAETINNEIKEIFEEWKRKN